MYSRKKFRSQTSDNMHRWKAEMGRVREEKRIRKNINKRKSSKKEDPGARKGRKAAKHSVFLPRIQRCFKRVESLLTERGEALKKVGAKKSQLALRSRHMLQFPMSTFARIFLERYSDEVAAEQTETMAVWEEKLCEPSAADREAASAGHAAARAFGQHRVVEQLAIAGVIQ